MGPSVAAVIRVRYWMGMVLRAGALLMILWGTLQLLGGGARALPDVVHLSPAHIGAVLLWPLRWVLVALVLLLLEKRLLKWLFPIPRQACPQCGYPTAGRPMGTCPECGLSMGVAREPSLEPERVGPPGYRD